MRKNYVYAMTIVVMVLVMWCCYCVYKNSRPKEYKNGIFVEIPMEEQVAKREIRL